MYQYIVIVNFRGNDEVWEVTQDLQRLIQILNNMKATKTPCRILIEKLNMAREIRKALSR